MKETLSGPGPIIPGAVPPAGPSTLDRGLDMAQYPRLLWRRRGIIALCATIVFCAAVLGLIFVPPLYESSAKLSIEDRHLLSRDLEQVIGGWNAPNQSYKRDEERLAKINGRIRSRPFLEQIVRTLKITEDPQLRQAALKAHEKKPGLSVDEAVVRAAVARISPNIYIQSQGPGLFLITVSDYTPENAQMLARWISESYITVTMQKEMEQIQTLRQFGADQEAVYEKQLAASEEALRRYQGSMIGQSLNSGSVDTGNLGTAESAYRRMSGEASAAETRARLQAREAAGTGLSVTDARLTTDPGLRETAGQLGTALDRMALDPASAGDPQNAAASRSSVASLRAELYREVEARTREIYPAAPPEQVRVVASAVFARFDADCQAQVVARLKGSIDAYKARAQNTPGNNLTQTRLQAEVDKNRKLLESFRAQMTSSDISQAMESTNLGLRMEILDPAQTPSDPVSPDRNKILVMALLIGPLLGIGLALMLELTDPTLRSLEDIHRVAPETVLGTLPLIHPTRPTDVPFLRRHWLPITVGGLLILTVVTYKTRAVLFPSTAPGAHAMRFVSPDGDSPR